VRDCRGRRQGTGLVAVMDFGMRMGLNGKGDCRPFSNIFVIWEEVCSQISKTLLSLKTISKFANTLVYFILKSK
jgi:hypothetical protein